MRVRLEELVPAHIIGEVPVGPSVDWLPCLAELEQDTRKLFNDMLGATLRAHGGTDQVVHVFHAVNSLASMLLHMLEIAAEYPGNVREVQLHTDYDMATRSLHFVLDMHVNACEARIELDGTDAVHHQYRRVYSLTRRKLQREVPAPQQRRLTLRRK